MNMLCIRPYRSISLIQHETPSSPDRFRHEDAKSVSSGLVDNLSISEDTCSFVVRMVTLQSLASLLGSTRPRIPTFPAPDVWRTPASTSYVKFSVTSW